MSKKDIVEFLIGQKGNKGTTVMEKLKYDEVIKFTEQREKYFKILNTILKILFEEE